MIFVKRIHVCLVKVSVLRWIRIKRCTNAPVDQIIHLICAKIKQFVIFQIIVLLNANVKMDIVIVIVKIVGPLKILSFIQLAFNFYLSTKMTLAGINLVKDVFPKRKIAKITIVYVDPNSEIQNVKKVALIRK